MIIVLVCSGILAFLRLILPVLSVTLPQNITNILGSFLGVMATGFSFIANFIHVEYILALLSIIVAFDTAHYTWSFVLWCLKKIPFAHIE